LLAALYGIARADIAHYCDCVRRNSRISLGLIASDIRINAQPNIGSNDIDSYPMPSIATQESPPYP
jgi:hypothetical protein